MQYKFSKDPKLAGVSIKVYLGRKWRAEKKLLVVEERLPVKTLIGTVATRRIGLGHFPAVAMDRAKEKEKQLLI